MDYVKNIDLCRCLSLLLVVCTQSVEEFTAPVAGEYKLQCWGAEGRKQNRVSFKNCFPGKGGYSEGILKSMKPATIYISVGQSPGDNCSVVFNNSPNGLTSFNIGGSGGGATNITTTNRGELKNFASYKNEVLIVAGGGGSCEWDGQGGAGGGLVGKDGNPISNGSRKGTGGSQNSGGITGVLSGDTSVNGMFGIGGYGYANKYNDYGAQGGGGWYGGGGASYAGSAGGGSSYIGGVTNGITIAGDSTDPKQPTPDGNSEQVGQSGNGACVITQLSFN